MPTVNYDDVSRSLNVLEAGVLQGTLASDTARSNNRIAFNTAIARATSEGKELVVPDGTYEIYGGALLLPNSRIKWKGSTASRILQYQLNAPVIHVGPPLGSTGATCEGVIFDGALLQYAGTATSGGSALELTGVWISTFKNIHIGDPNQGFSGRTSVPWIGIAFDGASGVVPPFSNTWETIRIKHFGYRAIDNPRPGYDAASTGSKWLNIYISGGDSAGQQDTSGVANSLPVYFQMNKQTSLENFNVEWLKAPAAIVFDASGEIEAQAINLEGVSLKLPSLDEAGFINLIGARGRFSGVTAYDNRVLSANNISQAAVFRLYDGSVLELGNISVENTSKTSAPGTPALSLVRHMSGGGNSGVRVALQGETSLNNLHNLNRFDSFTFSGAPGALFTALAGFNSWTPQTLSNASVTHYTGGTPGVLLMTPSGANRIVTLSNMYGASDAVVIPRGVRRIVRREGGSTDLIVANHNGSTIATLTSTGSVEVAFDGTNWIVVA